MSRKTTSTALLDLFAGALCTAFVTAVLLVFVQGRQTPAQPLPAVILLRPTDNSEWQCGIEESRALSRIHTTSDGITFRDSPRLRRDPLFVEVAERARSKALVIVSDGTDPNQFELTVVRSTGGSVGHATQRFEVSGRQPVRIELRPLLESASYRPETLRSQLPTLIQWSTCVPDPRAEQPAATVTPGKMNDAVVGWTQGDFVVYLAAGAKENPHRGTVRVERKAPGTAPHSHPGVALGQIRELVLLLAAPASSTAGLPSDFVIFTTIDPPVPTGFEAAWLAEASELVLLVTKHPESGELAAILFRRGDSGWDGEMLFFAGKQSHRFPVAWVEPSVNVEELPLEVVGAMVRLPERPTRMWIGARAVVAQTGTSTTVCPINNPEQAATFPTTLLDAEGWRGCAASTSHRVHVLGIAQDPFGSVIGGTAK